MQKMHKTIRGPDLTVIKEKVHQTPHTGQNSSSAITLHDTLEQAADRADRAYTISVSLHYTSSHQSITRTKNKSRINLNNSKHSGSTDWNVNIHKAWTGSVLIPNLDAKSIYTIKHLQPVTNNNSHPQFTRGNPKPIINDSPSTQTKSIT